MWSHVKRLIKTNRFLYYPIKKYHDYISDKRAKILQKIGFKLNEEIYSAFKDSHIEYYAGFGTLLGVVRENSFIKYDDDLDYLVNIHDITDWLLIFNKLTTKGFTPKCFYIENSEIREIGFEKNGIQIDFFQIYEDRGRQCVNSYYRASDIIYSTNTVSIKKYYLEKISEKLEKNIKHSHFCIPKNYENILKAFYGENWRTPIKNFDPDKYVEYSNGVYAKKYVISEKI